MKFVKIYSLQRSGSNYTEWLIQNNFKDIKVFSNIMGWKHGRPIEPSEVDWSGLNWEETIQISKQFFPRHSAELEPYREQLEEAIKKEEVRHVVCMKNPYSWYFSWTKNPKHRHSEFKKWISMWNNRNEEYFDFFIRHENSTIVKYEDYFDGYGRVLERVGKELDLEPKDEWRDKKTVIGPRLSMSGQRFDMNFYKEKRYLVSLGEGMVEKIGNEIDPDFLKALGYSNE